MLKFRCFLLFFLTVPTFLGCENPAKTGKSSFSAEKQSMLAAYEYSDSLYAKCGRIDSAAFGDFIAKALDYVEKNPQDEISPEMLYRAGVGSMILAKSANDAGMRASNAKQALATFKKFQELYPENPSAKYCYWQRAIVYDDILGDWRSAESEYRDFINRYPNDSLTPGFTQYLKFLGKSDDEITSALEIK